MGQVCTMVIKNFKYFKTHFIIGPLFFIVIPCLFLGIGASFLHSPGYIPMKISLEEVTLVPTTRIYNLIVFYYPNNSKATDLLKGVKIIDNSSKLSWGIRGFQTEEAAVRKAKLIAEREKHDFTSQLRFVHFRNLTGSDVRYEIIIPILPEFEEFLMGNEEFEARSSKTLYLQSAVETAIIEQKTEGFGTKKANWTLKEKSFPTKCKKRKPISCIVPILLPAVFGVIFILPTITAEMCEEKATGLLEFLLIAGVARWKIKLGWFIFTSAFSFPLLLVTALLFSVLDLIEYTSFFLLLLLFILYWLALFSLCCCMVSLISKPRSAAIIVAAIISLSIFALSFAAQAGYDFGTMIAVRITTLLHPVIAFLVAFAYICAWEFQMKSAGLNSPYPEDQYQGLLEPMLYLIFQCFVFLLLSFYFDNVAPSKYGVKWPAYFIFLPSFWCPQKSVHQSKENVDQAAEIEPTQMEKDVGVKIQSLSKNYGREKIAVDGLTVSFFRNEITALLGHNGAGKSTTLNMLTGMISPTSGTATVNGYDIRKNMAQVRSGLGFCPQHNIFYPHLSVIDHMSFYGSLRGMSRTAIEEHSKSLLERMNMMHALKTTAGRLSGGMKRKLCIAIAFIGQPSVIILDEPTSAIDPVSRKAIWDMIIQYKSTNQATIVISTHHMQEADLLADRIAIIDNGALRCFGSSLWLKRNYGGGSKLTVAHQHSLFSPEALQDVLRQYVPVTLERFSGTEATYALPMEAARSRKLADAFLVLEMQSQSFGVSSFGISESTMEQVFFNVTMGTEEIGEDEGLKKLDTITYKKRTGCLLLLVQMIATWIKRFHLCRRSASFYILQFVAPLLILAAFLTGVKLPRGDRQAETELKLVHPWTTPGQKALFYAGEKDWDLITVLMEQGIGTRCMKETAVPSEGNFCSLRNVRFPRKTTDSKETGCECKNCPPVTVPAAQQLINSGVLLTNLIDRNITNYLLKQTLQDRFVGGVEVTGRNEYLMWAPGREERDLYYEDPNPPPERLTRSQLEQEYLKASFLNAFNNLLLKMLLKQSGNAKLDEYGITLYTKG